MVDTESEDEKLTVGSEVEVTSDEEGFNGAWYGATILEPVPNSSAKKRKVVLVQYRNLVTEDGAELLKEYVDLAHVRPLPPPDHNPSFEVNDAIDAFYQDGWWSGVILKDLGSSRFMIFFDNPPDIMEYELRDFRKHVEWVDGKWVRSMKHKQITGSVFSPGTLVEVKIQKDDFCNAWFPVTFVKEIEENMCLVKHLSSEDDTVCVFPGEPMPTKLAVKSELTRPTPPRSVERSYELLEKVEAYYDLAWRDGLITKVLGEGRYLVFFKREDKDKEFSQSEVRPLVEWIDGKWVSDSKEVLVASDYQENLGHHYKNGDLQEAGFQLGSSGSVRDHIKKKVSLVKNSRKDLMQLSTPSTESPLSDALTQSTKKLKQAATNRNATDLQPSKKVSSKVSEPPPCIAACNLRKMVINTPSKEVQTASTTAGTGGRSVKQSFTGDHLSAKTKSPRKNQIKIRQMTLGEVDDQMNDTRRRIGVGLKHLSDNKSRVIELQKVERSSQKRKRGRPRKFVDNASDESSSNNIAGVGSITDEAGKVCPGAYEGTMRLHSCSLTDSKIAARKEGDKVAQTNRSTEVEVASAGTTGTVVDDRQGQPLSTWIGEGKHIDKSDKEVNESSKPVDKSEKKANESVEQVDKSQKEVNESRLSVSPGRDVNQRDEETELPADSPAVNASSNSVNGENPTLPFVKSSPVWKTIESMEFFHMMPQNPHFRPLNKCKEEYREGSAIGNMITFANLVEKTSKLQFHDPKSTFDSILETLLHLEKHGFEVKPLQSRINELISLKGTEQQHLDELKDLESKILQHSDDRNKYAGEMDDIMKKIRELQEKHSTIKSKHDIVSTELARLQTRSKTICESTRKAHIEFKKTTAAPWKLT